ncbi:hypothetical protein [Polaromonas sp. YR568]|uniref:hypothetical protein n=1 Tax=Polaromonas sp. YR568 TaxID=1855301 RepID=UPI003137E222
MAAEKVNAVPWDADRLAAMQPALDVSPWGPLATVDEAYGRDALFEFENDQQRALIVVRPVNFKHGRRLDIVGLRSEGDRLSAAALDRAVMGLAARYDADLLAMCTQVPHVAKSCLRHQWMVTGAVMLKVPKYV